MVRNQFGGWSLTHSGYYTEFIVLEEVGDEGVVCVGGRRSSSMVEEKVQRPM